LMLRATSSSAQRSATWARPAHRMIMPRTSGQSKDRPAPGSCNASPDPRWPDPLGGMSLECRQSRPAVFLTQLFKPLRSQPSRARTEGRTVRLRERY
jgi:hypothetical protein